MLCGARLFSHTLMSLFEFCYGPYVLHTYIHGLCKSSWLQFLRTIESIILLRTISLAMHAKRMGLGWREVKKLR